MVKFYSKPLCKSISAERIIGRYINNNRGPCLVVTAAVHGNEPSGVIALKRIFALLEEEEVPVWGPLSVLLGT